MRRYGRGRRALFRYCAAVPLRTCGLVRRTNGQHQTLPLLTPSPVTCDGKFLVREIEFTASSRNLAMASWNLPKSFRVCKNDSYAARFASIARHTSRHVRRLPLLAREATHSQSRRKSPLYRCICYDMMSLNVLFDRFARIAASYSAPHLR